MPEAKKISPLLGIDVNDNASSYKTHNYQSFSNEEQSLLPTKPLYSLPNHQYLSTNNNFGKSECNDVQLSPKNHSLGTSKFSILRKLLVLLVVCLVTSAGFALQSSRNMFTIESKFIKVPDLIRVKKFHVLTNDTSDKSVTYPDDESEVFNSMVSTTEKKKHRERFPTKNRLILVGDVHGNFKELKELMDKVSFDPVYDQLVLLGDFISKGPDSIKVLDYAIANNLSCIRGNHEDAILFAYTNIRHLPNPKVEPVSKYEGNEDSDDIIANSESPEADGTKEYNNFVPLKTKNSDIKLAKQLNDNHIKYIGSCPLIMDFGYVSKENTRAVGVHAGLHWNIKKLYNQPPKDVLTMRTLLKPNHKKATETGEGTQWSKVWNEKQARKPINKRISVFYGHDARHRLNLRDYSFGLDSNCVGGGQLTAMVITKLEDGTFDHNLVDVECAGI